MSPEAFGDLLSDEVNDGLDASFDFVGASAWDVAVRYHDFKNKKSRTESLKKLREISVAAVIARAQSVLGSIVHPVDERTGPLGTEPRGVVDLELEIEETLENTPWLLSKNEAVEPADIWVSWKVPRTQSVILAVDTSLSMTGEKLALTAVALAVVLLQFPEAPIGVVAFENTARVLKHPDERLTLTQLIERFLDVPAQGYTHLEDGLKCTLRLANEVLQSGRRRMPSAVVLTDGKYTAGRDPAYLAPRFGHLEVLKMGNERASEALCREMARKGKGSVREVGELEDLPSTMYGVVKDLLRGKARG
jgi:Mg-chelatase subunit ChlD